MNDNNDETSNGSDLDDFTRRRMDRLQEELVEAFQAETVSLQAVLIHQHMSDWLDLFKPRLEPESMTPEVAWFVIEALIEKLEMTLGVLARCANALNEAGL